MRFCDRARVFEIALAFSRWRMRYCLRMRFRMNFCECASIFVIAQAFFCDSACVFVIAHACFVKTYAFFKIAHLELSGFL